LASHLARHASPRDLDKFSVKVESLPPTRDYLLRKIRRYLARNPGEPREALVVLFNHADTDKDPRCDSGVPVRRRYKYPFLPLLRSISLIRNQRFDLDGRVSAPLRLFAISARYFEELFEYREQRGSRGQSTSGRLDEIKPSTKEEEQEEEEEDEGRGGERVRC